MGIWCHLGFGNLNLRQVHLTTLKNHHHGDVWVDNLGKQQRLRRKMGLRRETMLSGSQGGENLGNAEKYKVAHPY